MKKKLRLFLNALLIIISLFMVFIVINHRKNSKVQQPYVFVGEENNNIVIVDNIKLNIVDSAIIFIAVYICIFVVINFFKKRNVIYILIINLIISSIVSFIIVFIFNNYMLKFNNNDFIKHPYNSYIVSPKGHVEYESNKTLNGEKIVSKEKNTNSILIKNGSSVTIKNFSIFKYGDSNDLIGARIYGLNSAVLTLKNSYLNINNSNINTFSIGGNGLFAVLENSKIDANLLNINTSNKESIGIVSSIDSEIYGQNITIKTSSTSSPALSSTRGGLLNISSSILKTTANASPLINTNSKVILSDSIGDANDAPAAYMTDNSYLKISNCKLNVTANKISEKNYDGAFILYNEFTDDDYANSSKINIYSSDISIKKQSKVFNKAPLFSIVNSNTIINISDSLFDYGSNIFLKLKNTNKDKNMHVVLNSDNQEITGDIILSKNVTFEMNFNNTTYYGSINNDNDVKNITINIDNESLINMTGDFYIAVLNSKNKNFDNIISNGYTIYYDKNLSKELNGKIIKLKDGGSIRPL